MTRCLLYLLLPVLILTGCGAEPGEQLIETYLDRLETAGLARQGAAEPVTLQRYPDHRDRTLELGELRVGLLGLFDYRRCEMQQLIGERNSILGRVMPISQRLLYEIRFLQQAEICRDRLATAAEPEVADAEFLARLREVIAFKRTELAAVFWNATFDSPELAKAHSLAVSPLVPGHDNGFAASLQAVDYFARLGAILEDGASAVDIDSATLENQYKILQAEQYGGRLLTTLALLNQALEQAVADLAAIDAESCPAELSDMHRQTVRDEFAPYLDQVQREGREWLDALERLLARQRVTPPQVMLDYHARMLSLSHPDGLWQRFERNRLRHARIWQQLERNCEGV